MKTIKVLSEQKILEEGESVLTKYLGIDKTVRFLSAWRQGSGDYLLIKRSLFRGDTAETLYEKISQYQSTKRKK
ncbi:MAG: hypothetical protein KAW56_15260 [Candidatus Marinimicrobia bacterium]|nr:hypothetical protein [Candidatus Neomarinimicrobiota bacterium]MCK4448427.1 hypothetical protein [Candidatus Neomarinimicrobiota bacterium]